MYPEEDIENLAEFQYLAHMQHMIYESEYQNMIFIDWKDQVEVIKEAWRASAKIAFDFIKYRE